MASIANGLVANQEPKTSHCLNWAKGSAWSSVVPSLDDAQWVVGIKKLTLGFVGFLAKVPKDLLHQIPLL